MATAVASLNTKIDADEKDEFVRNAEALGMTPSSVIKVFVRMFNEVGGFPFEVRRADRMPSTTYLAADDFDAFSRALEEPMPAQTKELLERRYEWAD